MDLVTAGAVVGIVVAAGYLGPAVALYLSARAAERRAGREPQAGDEGAGEVARGQDDASVPR